MSKCFLLIFIFPILLSAQTKKYPYQAQTLEDDVPVFKEANFDSPVIANLPGGKIYDVSAKKFNQAFYRLRVKPGLLGYVSDADVRPLFAGAEARKNSSRKNPRKAEAKEKEGKRKQRPFQYTQFAGFQYASIQYREDTMGGKREEGLGFFGAKISGPNLVVEGEAPTEMNFLFHYGAPGYYEKLTGRTADGWILLMDFLFQNYYPQSKNGLAFFGFGPMMKYSKFTLGLTDATTGRVSDYSAEDISVGAVFNAGGALRFNRVALRGELQYYWEKLSYLGLSLSLQFAF